MPLVLSKMSAKSLLYFSFVIFFASTSEASRFRCDYTYFKEAGGYLKYQEIPATWHEAMLRCALEGTVLVSPLNPQLRDAIIATANETCPRGIWTGINALFSKGDYFSVEGVPLYDIPHEWMKCEPDNDENKEECIVMMNNGQIADATCNETLPYVCFKKTSPGMAMSSCGSPDNQYVLDQRTNKCYKFHRNPRVWSRAVMACAAEGGHLAVINSEVESQVLKDIFNKGPMPTNTPDANLASTFIGITDLAESGDWRTIHGETLEQAGYEKWSPGEPNNFKTQFCGAMYKNGLLDDAYCEQRATFICEKDPESLMCDHEKSK